MLNAPHGGELKDLLKRDAHKVSKLAEEAKTLPHIVLRERHLCDLELIMNGGFSPLTGFMTQKDYENVLVNMRLANGILWPMPITLDVGKSDIDSLSIKSGSRFALIGDGEILAILNGLISFNP
jgi:sulfate adenylyltransferase